MTINAAIGQINALRPNKYTREEKIAWLSHLDGMIKLQLMENYEDSEDVYFDGYDGDTDGETELIVPPPFDMLYIRWLEAQIDYANSEYKAYNNSVAAYTEAYDTFAKYYHRTHMPRTKRIKY